MFLIGGTYQVEAFGGVSANSCWNPLQEGIDYSEWRETVNRDIAHSSNRFFESLYSSWDLSKSLHWILSNVTGSKFVSKALNEQCLLLSKLWFRFKLTLVKLHWLDISWINIKFVLCFFTYVAHVFPVDVVKY